jgi:hypothetical protein
MADRLPYSFEGAAGWYTLNVAVRMVAKPPPWTISKFIPKRKREKNRDCQSVCRVSAFSQAKACATSDW